MTNFNQERSAKFKYISSYFKDDGVRYIDWLALTLDNLSITNSVKNTSKFLHKVKEINSFKSLPHSNDFVARVIKRYRQNIYNLVETILIEDEILKRSEDAYKVNFISTDGSVINFPKLPEDLKDLLYFKDFKGKVSRRKPSQVKLPPAGKINRYIITGCQNNTKINKDFFNNLLAIKDHFDAELLISRLTYNKNSLNTAREKDSVVNKEQQQVRYDPLVEPYLNDDYLLFGNDRVYVGYSDRQITASNPLSSSKHKGWIIDDNNNCSFILAHPKIQVESYAVTHEECTQHKIKVGHTTGVISNMNYIQNEAGHKAEIYHRYGAVMVEVDHTGKTYCHQLIGSDDGNYSICHLDVMAIGGKILKNRKIPVLVLGDTHNGKLYKTKVYEDFLGENNIFKNYVIENLFLHDTLDFDSKSHHTEGNIFKRFVQHHTQQDDVFDELDVTVQINNQASKLASKVYIVESNHDDHFTKYLNGNVKFDDFRNLPVALISMFFKLMIETGKHDIITNLINNQGYEPLNAMIKDCREHDGDIYEFISRKLFGLKDNVHFLDATKDFKILDTLLNLHGDKGKNGSRSPKSIGEIGSKTIIGHPHSPCYTGYLVIVGFTGENKKFGYAVSITSWSNAFAIIYENGVTTLNFYQNGNFKH